MTRGSKTTELAVTFSCTSAWLPGVAAATSVSADISCAFPDLQQEMLQVLKCSKKASKPHQIEVQAVLIRPDVVLPVALQELNKLQYQLNTSRHPKESTMF